MPKRKPPENPAWPEEVASATKQVRAKRRRLTERVGVVRAELDPETIEHLEKCEYAVSLHFGHASRQWPFWRIAQLLWPIGEDGNPVDGAKPMWPNQSAARHAVIRYMERRRKERLDDAQEVFDSRADERRSFLLPAAQRGDAVAIQQLREEDLFEARRKGAMAPTKIAPTTPDGKDAVPLLGGGLTGLLAAARQSSAGTDEDAAAAGGGLGGGAEPGDA